VRMSLYLFFILALEPKKGALYLSFNQVGNWLP